MKIKLRKKNEDGFMKTKSEGVIKEVVINEDFMNPNKESVAICFRGKNSSGIVEMTTKEFEDLYKELKSKMHLIKGAKIFRT